MGWAKDLMRVELSIIPIVNWERNQYLDETNLPWKKPIPYIDDINSLL